MYFKFEPRDLWTFKIHEIRVEDFSARGRDNKYFSCKMYDPFPPPPHPGSLLIYTSSLKIVERFSDQEACATNLRWHICIELNPEEIIMKCG